MSMDEIEAAAAHPYICAECGGTTGLCCGFDATPQNPPDMKVWLHREHCYSVFMTRVAAGPIAAMNEARIQGLIAAQRAFGHN